MINLKNHQESCSGCDATTAIKVSPMTCRMAHFDFPEPKHEREFLQDKLGLDADLNDLESVLWEITEERFQKEVNIDSASCIPGTQEIYVRVHDDFSNEDRNLGELLQEKKLEVWEDYCQKELDEEIKSRLS